MNIRIHFEFELHPLSRTTSIPPRRMSCLLCVQHHQLCRERLGADLRQPTRTRQFSGGRQGARLRQRHPTVGSFGRRVLIANKTKNVAENNEGTGTKKISAVPMKKRSAGPLQQSTDEHFFFSLTCISVHEVFFRLFLAQVSVLEQWESSFLFLFSS